MLFRPTSLQPTVLLGGRRQEGVAPWIRPPSITKQLAVVSAAFAAVYVSIAGLLRFTLTYTHRLNAV